MKDLKAYIVKLRMKSLFTESTLNKTTWYKHNLTFMQWEYPNPGKQLNN